MKPNQISTRWAARPLDPRPSCALSRVLVPGLTAALLLDLGAVSAQEKPATAPLPQPVLAENATPQSPNVLEIANGALLLRGKKDEATLANAAELVRGLYGDVNIVLTPDAGRVKVGDLKLRSVNRVEEVLEALRVASGYKFVWRVGLPANVPSIDPTTGLPMPSPASEGASLYALDVAPPGDSPAQAKRIVEVFGFGGYKENLRKKFLSEHQDDPSKVDARAEDETLRDVDQLQKIVGETLSKLNPDSQAQPDQPSFQFHRGANLLVVIGSPEAIEVASKVLTALPGVTYSAESRGALPSNAEDLRRPRPPVSAFGQRATPTEAQRAVLEAMRTRYGLPPGGLLSNPPAPPRIPEAMLRRYGLAPSGAVPPVVPAPPVTVPPPLAPPAPVAPPAPSNAPVPSP